MGHHWKCAYNPGKFPDIIPGVDVVSTTYIAITIPLVVQELVFAFWLMFKGLNPEYANQLIVMILGAFGMATMWEAVFADVGVAFLAILNAVRIQGMRFY
jgi:Cd2+/Zn2+-exporting ATPase